MRREDNGMSDTHEQSIEELSGSYRDIGRQHGEHNAAHIRYLLQSYGVSEAAPWEPRSDGTRREIASGTGWDHFGARGRSPSKRH